jgi:hypothetical protein
MARIRSYQEAHEQFSLFNFVLTNRQLACVGTLPLMASLLSRFQTVLTDVYGLPADGWERPSNLDNPPEYRDVVLL